jgi:CheY-like chemotaxis protein
MTQLRIKMLVADDDTAIVRSLKDQIESVATKFKDHVDVLCASSAVEVLQLLAANHVDVLFLDYHFEGGMNGDEIIDRIVDPFGQKLIVLMSGRSQGELEGPVIKRHRNLGSRFKFLRKPFELLELKDKYLEIEEFCSSRPYCFPIAYAHDALSTTTTYQGKLTAIKDLIEVMIKYAVTALTADCDRLKLLDHLNVRLSKQIPLTLGAWIKWLERLSELAMNHRDSAFMPELVELFKPSGLGGEWLQFLYTFKDKVRDPELGHGLAREEAWYASLTAQYEPDAVRLFQKFSFNSNYTLFAVDTIDFNATDNTRYDYRVRVLMGTAMPFRLAKFVSSARLMRGQLYLHAHDGNFLSLYPLMIYTVCEKCTLGRVYTLEWGTAAQVVYNTHCNHEVTVDNKTRDREPIYSRYSKAIFASSEAEDS